ncbi:hypothetical protein CCY99_01230 [Helicobacter sp. 16-1353]|uniref:epoxyqueuosine reductase QueH n=1 Tax=Helicobacter sp. 16-1353 TaxID=2004996 RepID=UPI000DCD3E4D|nr:epoxyqueuosine reductase QueH [Helicobacter sp. 16-1353]RAX55349.1 hypothetical protein CCY99_01230 [Helicobacter sp. 16-1353]
MLVHICCSVDSHYFLQELKKIYPNEKFIAFFYNPNIHPEEEYELRLFDVKRSCKILDIDLIVGDYDFISWFDKIKGLEYKEEKGERCSLCFDERLFKSAVLASQLDEKSLTTTLLASPMKRQNELFLLGDNIAKQFGLEFVKIDVRSDGGTQRQSKLAKDSNLYRQNYCGCFFALEKQRNRANKLAFELFNDIGGQILKGSIKWNLDIFIKLNKFERDKTPHILQKNTINAYRLLSGSVVKINPINQDSTKKSMVLPSYIFTHSKSVKNLKSGKIFWKKISFNNASIMLGFCDNALFIDINSINLIFKKDYKNVYDMIYNPPLYDDELEFRIKILGADSIKPFIVLDSMIDDNVKINIDSVFQNMDIFELIKL